MCSSTLPAELGVTGLVMIITTYGILLRVSRQELGPPQSTLHEAAASFTLFCAIYCSLCSPHHTEQQSIQINMHTPILY